MKRDRVIKLSIVILIIVVAISYVFYDKRYKMVNDDVETSANELEDECKDNGDEILYGKPVIYVYPEEKKKVSIKLDFIGDLTYTYPRYGDGWDVIADVDGTLTINERQYSYLFWEGTDNNIWNINKGNVVKGSETESFLENALSKLGLMDKEANDFITYWLPSMVKNEYNLIYFADEKYKDIAKLKITPEPETLIRVFMVYKKLDKPIDIKNQVLKPTKRRGYTVVEWGGTVIK